MTKSLIMYFSLSGATKTAAETIRKYTHSDIIRLEPKTPYPTGYSQYSKVGMQQMQDKANVAIKTKIPDLHQYDYIFVGYPTWDGQVPRIINTMFAENDFSGSRVVPFSTSVSTSFKDTLGSLKAAVGDGVSIVGGFRYSGEGQARDYLNTYNLTD